ncbi:hypothetical protein JAAARDRAFT_575519 [Jaapia argillacea MUCL 33604]|uniref:Aminotransferase class I/classII large domain-containing protein n=1 Tax=Jaapia argillacea MUCL 33604 TaxID=933084 RepID=A0A067Q2L3_9AGAM|nr:hypothetical protein JAAARDRAFT_575519 [Jaapia argillacea MUCL 33604]
MHRDNVWDVIKSMKLDNESEAHRIFRDTRYQAPKVAISRGVNMDEETIPGIVRPEGTGVEYSFERAMANGFRYDRSSEWSNLGQGAPEVGPIPHAPARPTSIPVPMDSLSNYAPIAGVKALREAVARLYNVTYRKGMQSQYSFENVYVVPGGRVGLSRVASVIGDVSCARQVPDCDAYDQVLNAFTCRQDPTVLKPEWKYRLDIEQLKEELQSRSDKVIIASNPRNPTGQVIQGEELKELVDLSRECSTTLILDEIYSWYIYPDDESEFGRSISSAEFIQDVDEDPIIIIDGLTKNWRLPGWRVCWVVGPKNLITALSQSGSNLDGGTNHPFQLAAIPLLDPEHVAYEKVALQKHFKEKRDHTLRRLRDLGLEVAIPPSSTFYIWLDLSKLPPPLNNGLTFFEELLKEKTIVVPGIFFDADPSHHRNLFDSPCHNFVRISFGVPMEELDKGLDAIGRILTKAVEEGMGAFGHSYRKPMGGLTNAEVWWDMQR